MTGRSLAMALVDTEFAQPGTELICHIVGEERAVLIIESSPHDPDGGRMRL